MNFWKDTSKTTRIAIVIGVSLVIIVAMITGNFEAILELFK